MNYLYLYNEVIFELLNKYFDGVSIHLNYFNNEIGISTFFVIINMQKYIFIYQIKIYIKLVQVNCRVYTNLSTVYKFIINVL